MALNRLNKIGFNTSLANCLVKIVKISDRDENGEIIFSGDNEGNYQEVIKLFCFKDNRGFMEEAKYKDVDYIKNKTIFVSRYFESISIEDLLSCKLIHENTRYKINSVIRDESMKIDMEFECELDD